MNDSAVMNLLAVAGVTVAAVISPGPDFAMIVRSGVRHGRRTGVATALGIACGATVHATYALLGLGYIVARHAWVLDVVRYAGAAYLCWLGGLALVARGGGKGLPTGDAAGGQQADAWRAFVEGFLCNMLNPKTILFFVVLFTQVVDAAMPRLVLAGVGAFVALAHFAWFAVVVFWLTEPRFMRMFEAWRGVVERTVGACLVAFGLRLVLGG